MLRHMEDVRQFNAEENWGLESRAKLSLLRRVDDNHEYDIFVSSKSESGYEITIQEIIQESDNEPYGLAHRYHLDRDGFVRRYDYNPSSDKAKTTQLMSEQAMRAEGISNPNLYSSGAKDLNNMLEHTKFMIRELEERIKDEKLTKDMGLNDQPVDTNEINNIRELLEGAEPSKLY